MKKRENSTERRNEVLILYSSIMVFLLAISYVLIITSPPSDLLEYDNGKNMIITKHISWSEMSGYGGPILIFLALFSLLSYLIGLLTSIICEAEGKRKSTFIFAVISAVSVIVLALLVYPYYGEHLTLTLMAVGVPFYSIGSLFAPSARVPELSLAIAASALSLFALGAIIIGVFIFRILPILVVIILLVLWSVLWGFATGSVLGAIMKGLLKRRHRKRRKKQ